MAKIAELAEAAGLPYEGDGDLEVVGVRGLEMAGAEHLSFVGSPRYRDRALASPVRALVAPEGLELPGKTVIRSAFPQLTLVELTPILHPPPERRPGADLRAAIGEDTEVADSATVHPHAVLGHRVRVGERSEVGAGSVLGDGARVGDDCVIHPNVTVGPNCTLGDRVIVHAGTVIGSDGFGFLQHEGRHVKIPHVGDVAIEDDVEIGANCAIDRGTYGTTRIGRGTKMDNLVHIAHNCEVGPHSLFAGQSGVAGTSKMGAYFVVGGQSGIVGHLTIPDRVTVGPKSMMSRPGVSGETYAGIPARLMSEWRRAVAQFYGLQRTLRRLRANGGNESDEAGK